MSDACKACMLSWMVRSDNHLSDNIRDEIKETS